MIKERSKQVLRGLNEFVDKVVHNSLFGPITGCLFVPMYVLLSMNAPAWICATIVAMMFGYIIYRASRDNNVTVLKGSK